MIRTKDLVLFATVFVFLLVAIGSTLWLDVSKSRQSLSESVALVPGGNDFAADGGEDSELDRAGIIKRLREAIESGATTIEPVPSVTTDADTAAANTGTASAGVQRCAAPDDVLAKIGLWPLAGTEIAVREGGRVFYTETRAVHTGSTSSSEIIRKDYLALPLMPASGGQYCVPSEVIGVTPQGVLIFNSEVDTYAAANENLLLGYARDGHPIYGAYGGEVDECGGYQHPAGYRYVIKPESDYIIGCFVAPPQPLRL